MSVRTIWQWLQKTKTKTKRKQKTATSPNQRESHYGGAGLRGVQQDAESPFSLGLSCPPQLLPSPLSSSVLPSHADSRNHQKAFLDELTCFSAPSVAALLRTRGSGARDEASEPRFSSTSCGCLCYVWALIVECLSSAWSARGQGTLSTTLLLLFSLLSFHYKTHREMSRGHLSHGVNAYIPLNFADC